MAFSTVVLLERGNGARPSDANPGAPDRMRAYQFGVLASGPARAATRTPELEALQKAHRAHIVGLSEQGVLVAAGPFEDAGDYRGVFVFATDSMETARWAMPIPW